MEAANVPVFKKGNSGPVNTPISILNAFSKLFQVFIHDHDHVSHYLKFKFNPCQHGFIKSKPSITDLVTYLGFMTPLVGSQRQADASS
jgi:hypothetical protein